MTPAQQAALRDLIRNTHMSALIHGGCHGADRQAHTIWENEHRTAPSIYAGDMTQWLFSKKHFPRSPLRLYESYTLRNMAIVGDSDWLVAAPATPYELIRSGTWQTLRIARQRRLHTILIVPDGSARAVLYPSPEKLPCPS
jgi:hypothetical protein